MTQSEKHIPVPVETAKEIAERFRKTMVVILSYDPVSEMTHTTTYGVEPLDKERAADVGAECAKFICGDGYARRKSYSDYRFVDEGKRTQKIERLTTATTGAKHAIHSLLAFREGMTDEALQDVVAALDAALATDH